MKPSSVSGSGAPRVCPVCGASYQNPPALSRVDGRTEICPDCGIREALASLGCGPDAQEHILALVHAHSGN